MFDRKKALMRYPTRTLSLIPLHMPKDKMTRHGRTVDVGKAPVHANWTTRPYDSDKVRKAALDSGRNVGVRLTEEQLVVDIDPRNGGTEGWAKLCHDIGIDDSTFPKVITGSGGWHLYMSKPADVLIRDTLESDDYNGVEFKSKGRQVVAAGSIHPNGKPYRWAKDSPSIRDGLPPVPRALLKAIKRPPRAAVQGGGQITPDQLAKMLSKLDASDFDSHDKWLSIMMACHHGTQGDGRAEFVDWSTSDTRYAKDAFIIGKRWDSLHAERNDGVTYKTLNKYLRDADEAGVKGASSLQAMPSAQEIGDDFDDDVTADDIDEMDFNTPAEDDDEFEVIRAEPAGLSHDYAEFDDDGNNEDGTRRETPDDALDQESRTMLEEINETHVALRNAGKFVIMYEEFDPFLDRKAWLQCDANSFKLIYGNKRVQRTDMEGAARNSATHTSLGDAWLKWGRRREVKGLCFEPEKPIGEKDGFLNLWKGYAFAYRPEFNNRGSWKYMQELMHEVLAAGDDTFSDYLMNWCAFMIQHPATVPEVAVVLKGLKGTGKGTLGNTLVKLIGQHAIAIGSGDQLTGRFNNHMRNLIFLFADEATSPYDRAAEAKLRHLLTEPILNIEAKGVDTVRVKNLLHVLIASNEKWVVPQSADERRFAVQAVSSKWRGTDKFDKLRQELAADGNAGYFAMMAALETHKFPSEFWHPRKLPMTKALADQTIYSLPPIAKFLFACIENRAHGMVQATEGDWTKGPVTIFIDDFKEGFGAWCRGRDMKPWAAGRGTHDHIVEEIKASLPMVRTSRVKVPDDFEGEAFRDANNASFAITLPSLTDCAASYEESHKIEGAFGALVFG